MYAILSRQLKSDLDLFCRECLLAFLQYGNYLRNSLAIKAGSEVTFCAAISLASYSFLFLCSPWPDFDTLGRYKSI